jgi:protein phosphatase inhibitor 2
MNNEEEDQKVGAVEAIKESDGSSSPRAAAEPSTSPARRAKPALKKHHDKSLSPNHNPSSSSSDPHDGGGADAAKHLKWDEKAIEEHDLLRGTRMKIDEPNTPYTHYDSGAESDDSRRAKSPANQKPTLSWDVLQTRLDSVAAVRDAYPSSPSSHQNETDHSDVEEDRKKEMRELEFKEHRKRHYNEMELVRKYRQEHPEGIDVEDEEDRSGDDADAENED